MKNKSTLVLEPSTNTHVMSSESTIESKDLGNGILKLKIKGKGMVTHAEHGTICTESENVIKYVQQEVNPVTRALQNAFD